MGKELLRSIIIAVLIICVFSSLCVCVCFVLVCNEFTLYFVGEV